MRGSLRQRVVTTAAVAAAAVAAVTIALLVVSLTRPSDAEIQEEVARRFGVPQVVLERPIVQRVLAQTSEEAKSVVFEQFDESLVLGGAAGLLAAVGTSILIVRPWRTPAADPPDEHTQDPTAP